MTVSDAIGGLRFFTDRPTRDREVAPTNEVAHRMRYGLLSDIHANLPALHAALELLRECRVDSYMCAGDVVGYGAQPNECVELVAQLPGVCVAGNHDLIVTDRLDATEISDLARVTLDWTRGQLSANARAWLAQLPKSRHVDRIVVAHGSLSDVRRYVLTDDLAAAELATLREIAPAAVFLVLGHTHEAVAFGERSGRAATSIGRSARLGRGERWLLNPGPVGQTRAGLPRARVAVLDVDARSIDFHSATYDVTVALRALQDAGLPAAAIEPNRAPLARLARVLPERASARLRALVSRSGKRG